MKKDVIYVDIDDDITSIIGKVKASPSKIVALVPPKRIGVLQSVVNLKLLQRTAAASDKRIVMITGDSALAALAAGVEMPVAKNLQSKPEIAPVAALEIDDNDVIDGGQLPVGDHAASVSGVDTGDAEPTQAVAPSAPLAMAAAGKAPKKSKSVTIPNFDAFRNKVFLFGGLGVLLIGFIVWGIFFAPKATVAITAKTTPYGVNKTLKLNSGATLDSRAGVLSPISKEIKKTVSVDFTPTGKKEVGEKATGTAKFTRQGMSSSTISAGTELTSSSGLVFVTNSAVTIPASSFGPGCFPMACPGTATVDVTAAEPGAKYNGASGSTTGAPDDASASLVGSTSGGTDKTATVVSSSDVAKAKEKLTSQDANAVKSELKKQFGSSVIVIDESFVVSPGEPVSSPAVDSEATSAKLTAETVYTVIGIEKSQVESIIKDDISSQLKGEANQKIYDTGLNNLRFTSFSKTNDNSYAVTLIATGMVGPNIDSAKLAKQLVGKRVGEIQDYVQGINGVESVESDISPFWVTKAPAEDKITIKFVVRNEAN